MKKKEKEFSVLFQILYFLFNRIVKEQQQKVKKKSRTFDSFKPFFIFWRTTIAFNARIYLIGQNKMRETGDRNIKSFAFVLLSFFIYPFCS